MRRLIILSTIVLFLSSGCQTWGHLDMEHLGTPADSVLVFGSFLLPYGKSEIKYGNGIEFRLTQLNPEKKPGYFTPVRARNSFTIQPQEPGAYLKLTYYLYSYVDYYYTFVGIQVPTAIDFQVPTVPGLYYTGSYILKEGKKIQLDSTVMSELESLQDILLIYANTEWEHVILARIKELTDAKN